MFGQTRNLFDGIGLKPLLRSETGLEGGGDLCVVPPQPFFQKARRFLALAVIRIAFHQVPLGQSVVGTDQNIRLGIRRLVGTLNRFGQRVDVRRAVEVGMNNARCRLPFFVHQGAKELIVRGRTRGTRILWVEREEKDPVAALLNH